FQAEDGIRDLIVTGVQTCALPISLQSSKFLLLLPILLCAPGYAQVTSGSIFGSVKDSSGAYVPNAKVTVQNASVGLFRTVTTSRSEEHTSELKSRSDLVCRLLLDK